MDQSKTCKRWKRHCKKEDVWVVHKLGKAVQHHHQRNAKATVWQHCTSTRKAKNKNKNWQDQMLLRMWSNWNSWASDGSVHFCYHFGREFGSFLESEIYIYHMTQQFHTWVFIREKMYPHKETWTWMFLVALFVTVRNWN